MPRPFGRAAPTAGAAWLARLVTESTAALAALSLFGFRFGVLTPVVWIVLAAMMLTFVALAPVTTLLTIVGIAVAGLAMVIPEAWLPEEAPAWVHRQLPLNRWIGTITILLALLLISSQRVDRIDRFLRGMLDRGRRTSEAIDDRLTP